LNETVKEFRKLQDSIPGGLKTLSNGRVSGIGSSLANANAQAIVHTWHSANNKLDVYRVEGTFANTNIVKGVTSGASWNVTGVPDDTIYDNDVFEDINDNTRIQTEGSDIMDWTETNPFGEA
jgi:hypothetical protein